MIAYLDPLDHLWHCPLPDEPGRPVLITETLEEMVEVLRDIQRRRKQWDSSSDSRATATNMNI